MVLIDQSRNENLFSTIRIFIISVNSTLIRKHLKVLMFIIVRSKQQTTDHKFLSLCFKRGEVYIVLPLFKMLRKKIKINGQKKKYSTAMFYWASIMFLNEFECLQVERISPVCQRPTTPHYFFYSHFLLPFWPINAFEFTSPQTIMRLKSKNIILIITINQ